eukprot:CAMPEP_0179232550 /NCGR_PEP_ID=MMETSP0797-20121207/11917_1 /TAXON_ID=47934 /ORGANISM="Dinophysis acuminata, Strain DAEP01" /LENGTH=533 /DNA_ID=CAMNT_0020939673 /DNA_START=34 /DNA_END=1632 /DNA_ORIENTATION=-
MASNLNAGMCTGIATGAAVTTAVALVGTGRPGGPASAVACPSPHLAPGLAGRRQRRGHRAGGRGAQGEERAVRDRVPGAEQHDLPEAAGEEEDEGGGGGHPRLAVPLRPDVLAHVADDDREQEAAERAAEVPVEVHVGCHRGHRRHRDQHQGDPDDRALPRRAQDLPRQRDLREPHADEPEAGRRGADGKLVGVDDHAHEVADDAAAEVDQHHLVPAELLLHAEAHAQLEEHVEEEVCEVGVERHGAQEPPQLASRDGGAPGGAQPVQDAGRRVRAAVPEHHGERELDHLPARDLPDEGITIEAREDQLRELLLLLRHVHHLLQGRRRRGHGREREAAPGGEELQRPHRRQAYRGVLRELSPAVRLVSVSVGRAAACSAHRQREGPVRAGRRPVSVLVGHFAACAAHCEREKPVCAGRRRIDHFRSTGSGSLLPPALADRCPYAGRPGADPASGSIIPVIVSGRMPRTDCGADGRCRVLAQLRIHSGGAPGEFEAPARQNQSQNLGWSGDEIETLPHGLDGLDNIATTWAEMA